MERRPSIDGMSNWLSGSEVQAGRLEEAQNAQQGDGPAPVFLSKGCQRSTTPRQTDTMDCSSIANAGVMKCKNQVSAKPCSSAAEGSESVRASYLLTAGCVPYLAHTQFWFQCLFPSSLLCMGMEEHEKSRKRRNRWNTSHHPHKHNLGG